MRHLASVGVLALGLIGIAASSSAIGDESKTEFVAKDLAGWEGLNQFWSVMDGALIGSTYPDGLKFNTFLCSKKKYKDFELKFQIRLKEGKGNSGVQVRSEVFNREHFAVKGPQADIGQVFWGCLYGEHFGGMMKEAPRDKVNEVLKRDGFNDYTVKCVGKHCKITINGAVTVDDDFPTMPEDGIIAWQLHAGEPMEATFKNIVFKDLSAK
jgi:Domain of Unknown Function (DUF1080)